MTKNFYFVIFCLNLFTWENTSLSPLFEDSSFDNMNEEKSPLLVFLLYYFYGSIASITWVTYEDMAPILRLFEFRNFQIERQNNFRLVEFLSNIFLPRILEIILQCATYCMFLIRGYYEMPRFKCTHNCLLFTLYAERHLRDDKDWTWSACRQTIFLKTSPSGLVKCQQ